MPNSSLLSKAVRFFRENGPKDTLSHVFFRLKASIRERNDLRVDRRYGTDTSGVIDDMETLGVDSSHRAHAFGYEGIQLQIFEDILRAASIAPQDFVFVDFGSGKGRAVMMAAEIGFARVYGVEFSPVLHEIALENLESFGRKSRTAGRISLYCQDAAEFSIPLGNLFCFFYNPFDAVVMRKVIKNISESIAHSPRRIIVAYRNPVCAELFDDASFLQLKGEGKGYKVYQGVATQS